MASRSYDVPLAWTLVSRTAPAKCPRVGALENAAGRDRPSGSEELHPARTRRVRGRGLAPEKPKIDLVLIPKVNPPLDSF